MNPGILLLAFAAILQQGAQEKTTKGVFTSKTCGFSIAMPGPTTESFQTEQTPSGPLINKIFQYAEAERVFTVIAADYPGEFDPKFLEAFLDGVLQGYTQNAGGKLKTQKKIKFQGEEAREVTFELQGGVMHSTYFISGTRIFQILVFYSDPANDKPAEAKKFTDSFRLVKAAGKLTDGMDDLTAWKEYHNDGGGYTIKILGEPKETTQNLDAPGGQVELKMIQAIGLKGENFGVSYSPVAKTDPPQTPKVLYELAANGAAENLKGKILSRKAISYKGRPGSEVTISLPGDIPFPDGVFMVRMYWIGDRLYQVVYVGPKSRTTTPEVREFFDSFELDQLPPK